MPRVQQKRGTAAALASVNPTPAAGELIVVSDENTLVIGNGTDAYTSLAYVTATPRSHKSTHATGGSDALSPADIGAAPAASPTFTGVATFAAGSAGAPALVSGTGTSDTGVYWRAADEINFSAAGTERMRVSTFGIDIYQPSNGADVARVRLNSAAGSSQLVLVGYGASFTAASIMSLGAGSGHLFAASGSLGVSTSASEPVVIGTAGIARVRVKATGSVRFVPLSADPASNNEAGDVYYNSSTNKLRAYNGTSWVDLH